MRSRVIEASGKEAVASSILGTRQEQNKVCCSRWEVCKVFLLSSRLASGKKKRLFVVVGDRTLITKC